MIYLRDSGTCAWALSIPPAHVREKKEIGGGKTEKREKSQYKAHLFD